MVYRRLQDSWEVGASARLALSTQGPGLASPGSSHCSLPTGCPHPLLHVSKGHPGAKAPHAQQHLRGPSAHSAGPRLGTLRAAQPVEPRGRLGLPARYGSPGADAPLWGGQLMPSWTQGAQGSTPMVPTTFRATSLDLLPRHPTHTHAPIPLGLCRGSGSVLSAWDLVCGHFQARNSCNDHHKRGTSSCVFMRAVLHEDAPPFLCSTPQH